MDLESISAGAVGFGIIAASVWNGWQARQTKAETSKATEAAQAAQRTLTTNNGGSHVKDALDRLEAGQADLAADFRVYRAETNERLTALEAASTPPIFRLFH